MKMNSGTFDLHWHSYSHHYQELMNNLLQTGDGSDVTLVCDDNVKMNVHKFILKASSPVFSNILAQSNESSKETIYLRGVNPTCSRGAHCIVTALNFWSSLAPRRSILLSPPASKFGHMGTLCDPDAKNFRNSNCT